MSKAHEVSFRVVPADTPDLFLDIKFRVSYYAKRYDDFVAIVLEPEDGCLWDNLTDAYQSYCPEQGPFLTLLWNEYCQDEYCSKCPTYQSELSFLDHGKDWSIFSFTLDKDCIKVVLTKDLIPEVSREKQ